LTPRRMGAFSGAVKGNTLIFCGFRVAQRIGTALRSA
jgi:hypothetical protein